MPLPIDVTLEVDEKGKLVDRRRAEWLWSNLRLYAGSEVRIRISRPKRSTRANAYYWGVVIETIRRALLDAGQAISAEALHEHFKRLYLPARAVCVFGVDHVLPGSTADLDSTTFADYIEAIKQDEDVLTLGVYIPEPEPGLKSYAIAEP